MKPVEPGGKVFFTTKETKNHQYLVGIRFGGICCQNAHNVIQSKNEEA
jgi:hypothetical protein